MKWKEFWSDQDQTDNNYKPELFPKEKSNLPPKTSKNLKTSKKAQNHNKTL